MAIDLGSTMPERDGTLLKVDFGPLRLVLPGGKLIAEIPYDGYARAVYEANGGVVDLPAEALAELTLADLGRQLSLEVAGGGGLREAEYTAESDDHGVYLNQPGAPWSPRPQQVTVHVRYQGGKPPPGARLRIAQYAPPTPGFNEMSWQLVSSSRAATASQTPFVAMDAGKKVTNGAYVTVPVAGDGTVTLSLSAIRSGPSVLQFWPLGEGDKETRPGKTILFQSIGQQFFVNVRCLPFHNDLAVAFENWLQAGPTVDLVSQRVFDAVFRTFFLMYPAMRFIRDPLQLQAWRGRVCAVTDPARFEAADYMPVTRSLSAGQRKILELWNVYLDGKIPTPPKNEVMLGRRA
jgi:hypothetical protein